MHAIFVAHGPFADRLKRRRKFQRRGANGLLTVIPPFRNLEVRSLGRRESLTTQVYNLVTELLGIPQNQRAPNNGTDGFWRQYL